jgi:hypothetical protein
MSYLGDKSSTSYSAILLLFIPVLLAGCKSTPAHAPTPTAAAEPAPTYPARPTTPPAPFRVFHHGNNSFTLVVPETATDDQISAVVWQLRDAGETHTFDKLHLPQKQVDAYGPSVAFHIYRGTKCAAEKYAPGEPPCGGSYHAAGDYTLDTHTNPPWENGVILHGEDRTSLWDADATTKASTH